MEGAAADACPVGSLPSRAGASAALGGTVAAAPLSGVGGEAGGAPWAGSLTTCTPSRLRVKLPLRGGARGAYRLLRMEAAAVAMLRPRQWV